MMSELMMDYGDRDWLQSVADNDTEDNILSIGRATRIVNSIAELEAEKHEAITNVREVSRRLVASEAQLDAVKRENKRLSDGVEVIKEMFDDPRLEFVVHKQCANVKPARRI
jgi:hypothetical protein